jgi:hypothetical protein
MYYCRVYEKHLLMKLKKEFRNIGNLAFVRCDTSGTDMREYVEEQQLWLY